MGRGWGAGGRKRGGIQADPFGVRDMPADVWSRLMETTVACSPHQPPPTLPSRSRLGDSREDRVCMEVVAVEGIEGVMNGK